MIEDNSLVSIVITVYNRDSYLEKTINSILNSTYKNIEIIIWDDGSTDSSVDIALFYCLLDRRIRLFRSAENEGAAIALIKALTKTTGEYIGLVDSDDLLHPESIKECLCCLNRNKEVGVVYTKSYIINEKDNVVGIDTRAEIPFSKENMLLNFISFHFRLFKKKDYSKIPNLNSRIESAIDYDLFMKLSEVTNFIHLPKPLYFYRKHSSNISSMTSLSNAYYSELVIKDAIERRGLSNEFKLEVRADIKYVLLKKQNVS